MVDAHRMHEPMKGPPKDEYRRLLKHLANLKPDRPPDSDTLKYLVTSLPKLLANRNAGKIPQFGREPRKGSPGELSLRNRLWWLRCLPMANRTHLFLLSPEYPVYELPKSRLSIDLLGILKNDRDEVAYTAVIELKWKSNNPLYALFEVARNAVLLVQSKVRVTQEHIIGMVVGPFEWYDKYCRQKKACIETARKLRRASSGIRFEFWTFPEGTQCSSAPPKFLPLTRFW